MARSDRLFDLLQVLRDHDTHTAQALATRLGVSVRTLYRDMETLAAAGVPVEGTRGTGYRLAPLTTLPPLSLTAAEMEVLDLALAITAEVSDSDLREAAASLMKKLDAALPQSAVAQRDAWKFAASPFADTARGIALMPTLRAAIKARQKLRITYTGAQGSVTSRTIHPLHLAHEARVWTLIAWCELRAAHRVFRLDLVNTAEALPALFPDTPGRGLDDYLRA